MDKSYIIDMRKNVSILRGSSLRHLVSECVHRVLSEGWDDTNDWDSEGDDEEEMKGWVNVLFDKLGLPYYDEALYDGEVTLEPDSPLSSGVLEYCVVDYGEPGGGLECTFTPDDPDEIDYASSCAQRLFGHDDFFEFDDDYAPSPNFYRFRLVAPY